MKCIITLLFICHLLLVPQLIGSPEILVVNSLENIIEKADGNHKESIQMLVTAIFGHEILPVVECESNFQQFEEDDLTPLISPTGDVGVMQINIATWKEKAEELDLDIYYSTFDNLLMGKHIQKAQGLTAWTCFNDLAIGI